MRSPAAARGRCRASVSTVTRNSELAASCAAMPRCRTRSVASSSSARRSKGRCDDASALVSTFSVDGRELDLAGWADVLPDEWPAPETGHGSVEVRGTLKGAALVQLAAEVDLVATSPQRRRRGRLHCPPRNRCTSAPATSDAGASAPRAGRRRRPIPVLPGTPRRSPRCSAIARLAFGLRAQKVGDTWRATVSNLNMARPTAAWLAARIEARVDCARADGRMKASGKTDRIVLELCGRCSRICRRASGRAAARAERAPARSATSRSSSNAMLLTARRSTRCRLASRTCRLRRCNARRAPVA